MFLNEDRDFTWQTCVQERASFCHRQSISWQTTVQLFVASKLSSVLLARRICIVPVISFCSQASEPQCNPTLCFFGGNQIQKNRWLSSDTTEKTYGRHIHVCFKSYIVDGLFATGLNFMDYMGH